jgi:hypothetical protein
MANRVERVDAHVAPYGLLGVIRRFAGTSKEEWGSLLTPLVTGLRVRGPFRPAWVPPGDTHQHVLIDTEGLLHAKTTTDVPSELASRFRDVDTILLVESAENALRSPVAGKVFEAVGSTGYTSKFLPVARRDLVEVDRRLEIRSRSKISSTAQRLLGLGL